MSLIRAGFTSMSRASRFWLMPCGFMNSSARISPGGIGLRFLGIALLLPPIIARILGRLIDARGEQVAEQAVAGFVRVAPVARPLQRHVGGGLTPGRTRV